MKTSEFIKVIEDAGFEVSSRLFSITIIKKEDYVESVVGKVSKVQTFKLNTYTTEFDSLPAETKKFLTETMFQYAQTPIKDREGIKLNEYERMILESLHRDYTFIGRNERNNHVVAVNVVVNESRNLDMFEELFSWVQTGNALLIEDLLNG